jgi:predicted exporter
LVGFSVRPAVALSNGTQLSRAQQQQLSTGTPKARSSKRRRGHDDETGLWGCEQIGIFVLIGWELGIVEAISLTILVGLSCDFGLHLAESYAQSPLTDRKARAMDSVQRMGSPICAAALTTVLGVLPMCFSTLQILVRFAIIIPINMVLAILFGLHFFTPMLMLVRAAALVSCVSYYARIRSVSASSSPSNRCWIHTHTHRRSLSLC